MHTEHWQLQRIRRQRYVWLFCADSCTDRPPNDCAAISQPHGSTVRTTVIDSNESTDCAAISQPHGSTVRTTVIGSNESTDYPTHCIAHIFANSITNFIAYDNINANIASVPGYTTA
jgi:hypothetical protein